MAGPKKTQILQGSDVGAITAIYVRAGTHEHHVNGTGHDSEPLTGKVFKVNAASGQERYVEYQRLSNGSLGLVDVTEEVGNARGHRALQDFQTRDQAGVLAFDFTKPQYALDYNFHTRGYGKKVRNGDVDVIRPASSDMSYAFAAYLQSYNEKNPNAPVPQEAINFFAGEDQFVVADVDTRGNAKTSSRQVEYRDEKNALQKNAHGELYAVDTRHTVRRAQIDQVCQLGMAEDAAHLQNGQHVFVVGKEVLLATKGDDGKYQVRPIQKDGQALPSAQMTPRPAYGVVDGQLVDSSNRLVGGAQRYPGGLDKFLSDDLAANRGNPAASINVRTTLSNLFETIVPNATGADAGRIPASNQARYHSFMQEVNSLSGIIYNDPSLYAGGFQAYRDHIHEDFGRVATVDARVNRSIPVIGSAGGRLKKDKIENTDVSIHAVAALHGVDEYAAGTKVDSTIDAQKAALKQKLEGGQSVSGGGNMGGLGGAALLVAAMFGGKMIMDSAVPQNLQSPTTSLLMIGLAAFVASRFMPQINEMLGSLGDGINNMSVATNVGQAQRMTP